jgi:adenine-specific DNA-methyltransferase
MTNALEVEQNSTLAETLLRIAAITKNTSNGISKSHKAKMSQYFTEGAVATQMAKMLEIKGGAVIGDHGAGTGILGATVLAHAVDCQTPTSAPLSLRAFEIDELLHEAFNSCIGKVQEFALLNGKPSLDISLFEDFISDIDKKCNGTEDQLDAAILNPPYKKLNQSTELAMLLKNSIVAMPNIYAAFISITILMLKPKGQLVAIVPRSFTSGTYFSAFRTWLKTMGSIDWIVRYSSRSNVFKGDNVLQENIVFRFTRGVPQSKNIRVSLCDSPDQPAVNEIQLKDTDIFPSSSDTFFIPSTNRELQHLRTMLNQSFSFEEAGLEVSTGKMVEHRNRPDLTKIHSSNTAPVIYSQNWSNESHSLAWTVLDKKNKLPYLSLNKENEKLVIPRGTYVAIKRISANDGASNRCYPCVIHENSDIQGDFWVFDNHIQLITGKGGKSLPLNFAKELAEYLCSPSINAALRVISGTTQLNCTDIRQLRFPMKIH